METDTEAWSNLLAASSRHGHWGILQTHVQLSFCRTGNSLVDRIYQMKHPANMFCLHVSRLILKREMFYCDALENNPVAI